LSNILGKVRDTVNKPITHNRNAMHIDDLPIIAYHPESIFERVKAAWWCLTGRVVTIAIWIPANKYYK
jgi:hypothetical protein